MSTDYWRTQNAGPPTVGQRVSPITDRWYDPRTILAISDPWEDSTIDSPGPGTTKFFLSGTPEDRYLVAWWDDAESDPELAELRDSTGGTLMSPNARELLAGGGVEYRHPRFTAWIRDGIVERVRPETEA